MATIQWRPQVNALTTPLSYRIQYVPRNTAGYSEMATDISSTHPFYSADLILSLAPLIMEWIQGRLLNGDQVTLKDAFNFRTPLSGKLTKPNDPLPKGTDHLHVRVTPSRNFVKKIRQKARLERLPMDEKLPLITSCQDTTLQLRNVLNPDGILQLSGTNLFFAGDDPKLGCWLRGTRSGERRQSTYGPIANTATLLIPDIPPQKAAWNNEYLLNLRTQYTKHGTLRTGIYQRRLRTPLKVPGLGQAHPPETGILSGSSPSPLVVIIGGTVSAAEQLRIQAVLDLRQDQLLLSLLDMEEMGRKGTEVPVLDNGDTPLPGFTDSAVSSLTIRVQDYLALKKLIHDHYQGRLVDILNVQYAA
ncbi:MAG: DUF4469 domain-containing protein [Candidatus Electrothrix sp. GW3-4]|uniref:DUF4469 domain-containing protein n=1 Tax=Candidatus Electrothrix sp. GW3-4 TaxID=3126740 RepID=UPI0030CB9FD9